MSLSSFSTNPPPPWMLSHWYWTGSSPGMKARKARFPFTHTLSSAVEAGRNRGGRAFLCKDPGLLCDTLFVLGLLFMKVISPWQIYKCQLTFKACCLWVLRRASPHTPWVWNVAWVLLFPTIFTFNFCHW